jgi:hypothetical protein
MSADGGAPARNSACNASLGEDGGRPASIERAIAARASRKAVLLADADGCHLVVRPASDEARTEC